MTRTTLIAAAAALALIALHTASAQTAREIVARSDSVRNPARPFHVSNAVVNYVGGRAHDRLVLTVYSKPDSKGGDGQFNNLVRWADPPRDLGKMVLFNGTNMWFYDPAPKTSVRISPQQRLIGLASNGDVVTVSLARDYTPTLIGSDTLQDADRVRRSAWHLDLVAAGKDAVYSRIELWVEHDTYRPVKGKYYSDSGRPLKIAYFHKYEDHLGAVRPAETVIIDAVDPNLVTTMTLSGYAWQDIPDAWFQRDFLPRLSNTSVTDGSPDEHRDIHENHENHEDRDLAAIPGAVRDTGATAPIAITRHAHGGGRWYAEDATTASATRSAFAVQPPGPDPARWRNRTSLDLTERWRLPARLAATASGRVNVIGDGTVAFGYDWREAYLTWEPRDRTYLEAGRINLHTGVALGFNPTDYFKPRTLVDQASLDPSVVRQDRLGTLVIRAQRVWTGASASVVFAPKLYAPTAINTQRPTSTSLLLDHTNAADRWLATAGVDMAGLAPQVFVYHEGGDGSRTRVGADLSRLVSQSVVGYLEWSGGTAPGLAVDAVRYGKETGALPAHAPVPALGDSAWRFRNDLATGASWSNGAAKLTLNAELHYSDSGFDRAQWGRWFALGREPPGAAGELWYIRGYANDQQQPMARQQIFVRADRVDAFIRDLELTAFAFVSLSDGSSLTQLAVSYQASDAWTFAAYLPANIGGIRSERGSLPFSTGLNLQLVRYL